MKIRFGIFVAFLIFLFFGSGILISVYADFLWFSELGYTPIYLKILFTKISFSSILGICFFLIVWGNVKIAQILSPKNLEWYDEKTIFLKDTSFSPKQLNKIFFIIILFLSIIIGSSGIAQWQEFLFFLNPSPFNINDPIFDKDISFYIFRLPLLEFISSLLFTSILFSIIGSILVYITTQALSFMKGNFKINPAILGHLSVLLAFLAFIKSFQYWLNLYHLLYSTRGVAYGASYTDIYAQLIAYKVLMVISLMVGVLLLANLRLRQIRTPAIALGFWFATAILLSGIYPEIVQRFIVTPNELEKEKPYIENNIKFTNLAYGIDRIKEYDFPVADTLNREVINRNSATIDNVRLWDHRPLMQTYKQIQVIRQYYDFHDVDIDRYQIGNEYVQIMLSPREVSMPASARTWINERLVYTHGYGVAASRVNAVTPEGLPVLLVRDIPPISPESLKIERPEIYFGETQSSYVLVKTSQQEFDYPKGNENVYSTYQGSAGIPIHSFLRRLIFSYYFSSTDLLFTGTVTPESRIIYRRNILERVRTIMPFLSYDEDPYIVIVNGKLYWILDGYTISSRYPYSQPYKNEKFNYIRNSVKVILDAYNGTVDYYILDPTDPIIQSWKMVFPNTFKSMEQIPEELKSHLRYPERLFQIQADIYSVYHMRESQVFYNQEDKWTIPNEMFENAQQIMEPYYIIMRLPEESKDEFLMMIPFTPATKNNMIAWMAAKSDFPNYSDLIVYKFPKDKLVYGPLQIESRIDQDAEISEQLTLWSQRGSGIIRGNLLVIPIEDSILYVEPLYLKSEQSQIPELKRVIIAYGEKIVMEPTIEMGLIRIFGGKAMPVTAVSDKAIQVEKPDKSVPGISPTLADLAKQASTLFDRAQQKLKSGDWAGYGEDMQNLRDVLRQMEKLGK